MGARRHGRKCSMKSVFAANFVWNLIVDEVFMHHFEKLSSASMGLFRQHISTGELPVEPGPCWGTSVLRTSLLPTPEKYPESAHGQEVTMNYSCKSQSNPKNTANRLCATQTASSSPYHFAKFRSNQTIVGQVITSHPFF